jgi:hypothetical protein
MPNSQPSSHPPRSSAPGSTSALKFANSIILSMNLAPFTMPEKLDILQHVQKQILHNFTTEENERRIRAASAFSRLSGER